MRNIKVEVKVVVEDNRPAGRSEPRRFASQREYDNWLYAGQPDRVSYSSGRPGPNASKEEYDSWLYGGGGR